MVGKDYNIMGMLSESDSHCWNLPCLSLSPEY